ncbi:uncharacterized protein Pyn_17187 [Prunus yedoensis var. nudiflora]|uniref:Uncharacterized protein n=1 Tax=Prunus yedoensis var. nudiflora TaxID=2094558 RepID=A0A314URT0_PRUYE|nr:uncharacterized protein Pyn_17187 [Prunus yedoensis var. nudiflora]
MAQILRDRVFGNSKRHSQRYNPIQTTMPVYPVEDLPNPFGELGPNLSDKELRETVYEILVGACRSSGAKPLTYIPQSEKTDRSDRTTCLRCHHRFKGRRHRQRAGISFCVFLDDKRNRRIGLVYQGQIWKHN